MNIAEKSKGRKRAYDASQREEAAAETRARILTAAKALFARRGVDAVTIAELGEKAKVSASTVYALFKSKEGVLLAVMEAALFGGQAQEALKRLEGVTDPVRQVALTASVARAIYESETAEMRLIRGVSAFSPALRKGEQRFENMRMEMQRVRINSLYAAGKAKRGLAIEKARRLMWMYTSRDVWRMLVQDGGWTPDQYEAWLSQTLLAELVA